MDKYISDYVMELKSCQVRLEQTLDRLSKGNSRENLDELLNEVNYLKTRLLLLYITIFSNLFSWYSH